MRTEQANIVVGLPAGVYTGTTNGDAVDVAGYGGYGVVVFTGSAAISGTTPSMLLSIQDSANGTDGWAVVASLTVTTTARMSRPQIRLGETKRYLRAVIAVSGTDTPTFAASIALLCTRKAGRDAGNIISY